MFNLETLNEKINELNILTNGQIFPSYNNDEDITICIFDFLKISFLETDDKYNEVVDILLNEYVDYVVKDKKGLLKEIKDFGMKQWESYQKREKMYYCYISELELPKINNDGSESGEMIKKSTYDISVLKMFVDNKYFVDDDKFFKDPPFWIKTMRQFKYLVIPLNCQTVYLFNPEQKCLLDLRKEEVFNLNV